VEAPLRVSLDRLYGSQRPPEMAQRPSFGQPPTGTYQGYTPYQPSGTDIGAETHLAEQGWTQTKDETTGAEVWRPPAIEGQIYEDNMQNRFIFTGGEWVPMGGESDYWQYANANEQGQEQSLTAGIVNLHNLIKEQIDLINSQQQWLSNDPQDFSQNQQAEAAIAEAEQKIDRYNAMIPEIEAELNTLYQSLQDRIEGGEVITSWQDQYQDILEQIDTNAFINPDTGEFDIEALRNSGNIMASWVADVIEDSSKTGKIGSDFFVEDEEGNMVLAPELQNLQDFYLNNPEMNQQLQRFNRQMAHHALQTGQTLDSGFYSEYVAGEVGRSFATALKQAGWDTMADTLADQLKIAYAAIEQEFQQGVDTLAAQVAEQEAATTGNIISGLIGGLLNSNHGEHNLRTNRRTT
jgi:hypothetical protein